MSLIKRVDKKEWIVNGLKTHLAEVAQLAEKLSAVRNAEDPDWSEEEIELAYAIGSRLEIARRLMRALRRELWEGPISFPELFEEAMLPWGSRRKPKVPR